MIAERGIGISPNLTKCLAILGSAGLSLSAQIQSKVSAMAAIARSTSRP